MEKELIQDNQSMFTTPYCEKYQLKLETYLDFITNMMIYERLTINTIEIITH